MAIDREAAIRQADKWLRQGRLDAAIAEYVKLVEDQPRDWNSINALGDLYLKAGDVDRGVAQFIQIADHLFTEGFLPRAAAVYKKALKARPNHEHTLLRLSEIATKQELLADARAYLRQLWEQRSEREDERGAAECLVRLALLEESDAETKLTGARAARSVGNTEQAAALFRAAAEDFDNAHQPAAALDALAQVAALQPSDSALRGQLAARYVAAGQLEPAAQLLNRETAGADPALLLALGRIEFARGNDEEARAALTQLIAVAAERSADVLHLGLELAREGTPDHAFICAEVVVDDAVLSGDWDRAISVLESFLDQGPHISALSKLAGVAADAGREDLVVDAEQRLVDAYLDAGQSHDAQAIVERLLGRDPASEANVARLRRTLALAGVTDLDQAVEHIRAQYGGETLSVEEDLLSDAPAETSELTPVEEISDAIALPMASSPVLEDDELYDILLVSPVAESTVPVSRGIDEFVSRSSTPDPPSPISAPQPTIPGPRSPVPDSPRPEVHHDGRDHPMEFDLSDALEALGGTSPVLPAAPVSPVREAASPAADLETVFEGMRSRAGADADIGDAVALYERGLQLLESGQIEDAVADLESAALVPVLSFAASARLGRLYTSLGDMRSAVDWLERAAESPAPPGEDAPAVLYDLAGALEAIGEPARALAVLMELETDGEYRDVRQRIDRLMRTQSGRHE